MSISVTERVACIANSAVPLLDFCGNLPSIEVKVRGINDSNNFGHKVIKIKTMFVVGLADRSDQLIHPSSLFSA